MRRLKLIIFSFSILLSCLVSLGAQTPPEQKLAEIERLYNEGLGLWHQGTRKSLRSAREKFIVVQNHYLASGKKRGAATSLINTGRISSQLGDYAAALKYLYQALEIWREIGDPYWVSQTLIPLTGVHAALGENEKVLEIFTEIRQLGKLTKNKIVEAQALNGLAGLYYSRSDYSKSIDYDRQALQLYRERGGGWSEMVTLGSIGYSYYRLKDRDQALAYLERALKIARSLGNKRSEAGWLWDIGDIYLDLDGDKANALDYYQRALVLYRSAGAIRGETEMLSVLQRYWQADKKPRLAIFYGKQAVNNFQELRRGIQNLDAGTQKKFLKTIESTYRRLAELLIEQGQFAQAERVLRMLKEEEYFDFVRRDAGEIGRLAERVPLSDKEKALIEKYSLLADKITEVGQEFVKLETRKRRLSRLDQTLSAEEQKRFDELDEQLAAANGAFRLFLEKQLVKEIGAEKAEDISVDRSWSDKLREWGDGTVTLYTVVGKERYRVILTTPKVQIDGKTEIRAADLNKKVFAFRRALQNPNLDPRPLGKELYDILIKPIERHLKQTEAKTLVWSLDGTLRYIPLAALSPDGQRYLVEDFQNVLITSKTRDDLSVSDPDWKALGLGVSAALTVADPDDATRQIAFGQLPGTRRELLAIIRDEGEKEKTGVLPGRRFMNGDFTTTALKDSLIREDEDGKRRYNVVHIASHFRLGSNWSNSFLLLGNGETLTLEQINDSASMDFGAVELVTLSACNTGFADDANGAEVDSLASVIQTKSGKAVLATLWAVADESTSLLMSEFYRLRKENPRMTKAGAMQRAQQAMIRGRLKSNDPRGKRDVKVVQMEEKKVLLPEFESDEAAPFAHPYYWSPFVLIGNWR